MFLGRLDPSSSAKWIFGLIRQMAAVFVVLQAIMLLWSRGGQVRASNGGWRLRITGNGH